ncbi:NAD(P)-binding protein [Parathielavia appendiculata]|uniref:NAD(P)-binding protein n=1 Tax=Parathielavia appendiculata TaxID=2587402 RepID=A0AAN6TTI2_9PEZI|nr:NAD(P)-binding protein [Parathielavia appendiculata]
MAAITHTLDKHIAKAVLMCAVTSARTLTTAELSQGLKLDINTVLPSAKSAVEGLCGQLVAIDQDSGLIDLIHPTVREFLVFEAAGEFAASTSLAPERIVLICLQLLCSSGMRHPRNRRLLSQARPPASPFLDYALTRFSEHIASASSENEKLLAAIDPFLRTNMLSWIERLAVEGNLHPVMRASKNLKSYLDRRGKYQSPLNNQDRTILVLGAGPGIGRCVASLFASKRYKNVVLIARRAANLLVEKKAVETIVGHGRVNVRTYAVDTTRTEELFKALDDADAAFGKPEVVFYNAARVRPSTFFAHPVEDIEYDLKITVSALYTVSQRYMPHLVSLAKMNKTAAHHRGSTTTSESEAARPALIVTSSALPHQPIPQLFSLSLAKAAQRNLVQSLSLAYASEGVRVGVVTVAGPVSAEDEERSPRNIALKSWDWFDGDSNDNGGGGEREPCFEVVI